MKTKKQIGERIETLQRVVSALKKSGDFAAALDAISLIEELIWVLEDNYQPNTEETKK